MNRLLRPRAMPVTTRCLFSSSARRAYSTPGSQPSPPRLPKEEQELFERLQRDQSGAFSARETSPQSDTSSSASNLSSLPPGRPQVAQSPDLTEGELASATGQSVKVEADKEGQELHPHVYRGAKPEFTGDRNPKTGEIGGPKNEPLRWGGDVDWSYNGRVTDF